MIKRCYVDIDAVLKRLVSKIYFNKEDDGDCLISLSALKMAVAASPQLVVYEPEEKDDKTHF